MKRLYFIPLFIITLCIGLILPTATLAQDEGLPDGVAVRGVVQSFDFTEAQGWPVDGDYKSDGVYWMRAATIADGRYVLSSGDIAGIMFSGGVDVDNFYAQIEVYPETCPGDGAFGITFRMNTEPVSDYYYYYIQCEDLFNTGVVSGGSTVDIKDQGTLSAPLALDGARSVLGVLAQDTQITLYWNGQRVGGFTDALRARGKFGLSLAPASDGGEVKVAFDNLTIWALADPTADAQAAPDAGLPEVPTAGDDASAPNAPTAAVFTVPPGTDPTFEFGDEAAWDAWFVGEDGVVRASTLLGRYIITPLAGVAATFSGTMDLENFYAEATISTEACPVNGIIGVGFRRETPDGPYYAFGVRCDGMWLVQPILMDSEEIMRGQFDAPLAADGRPFTIGILARGTEFTIYWNGEAIGAFNDAQLAHGDIGFHVQEGIETISATVERLRVWDLDAAEALAVASDAEPVAVSALPEAPVSDTASAPPREVGDIRYQTNFDEAGSWPVGTYDYAIASIEDGGYVLTSTDIVSIIRLVDLQMGNFYVQYDVTPIQCPGNATFGLPFRIDRTTFDDFYVALMQCDGNWRLSAVMSNEDGSISGEVLISGELGAPLVIGETHTIGVFAKDKELIYYWDGVELGRVLDPTHVYGDFGLQIRPSAPDYQPLTIKVDNYRVWRLP